MPNAAQPDQFLTDAEWQSLAPSVWRHVPKTAPYVWPIDESSLNQLEAIAPGLSLPTNLSDRDQVVAMQEHLGPLMREATSEQLADISVWIVSSWGRINGPSGQVRSWAECLSGFKAEAIEAFIRERGRRRIASWSKLLAFALPDIYAIYDSRTALTLNFALYCAQDERRFAPPEGRPGNSATASAFVSRGRRVFGYRDYLAFLKAVRSNQAGTSLSDAEAALFSAAPVLADAFVASLNPHIASAAFAAVSIASQPRQ